MGSLFASRILRLPQMTAAIRCSIFVAVLVRLSAFGAAQTLPYIPTNIFIPDSKPEPAQDNATVDIAYIISPQGDSVNLLALNFSNKLQASSLSFQTLSSNVPFLDTNNTAFTPSLADNGSLIVYAGDCSSPANSKIWTFNPSSNNDASSAWAEASATIADDTETIQIGPSFLGSGFSFSNTLEPKLSPATTYVYGGMCPNATSDSDTSQSNASYSNQMIRIESSETGNGQFTINSVSSKGPPVPEAGFTFTGLSPSVSNHSGTVTQQVNYVLLGGHTQYAFINMSTVAIWSLPEESWSFISDIGVGSSSSANTELAVKSTIKSIDSRSGHTTVLSEDGTTLIVLGGWVGDQTQAASPQLAVLNIGANYGGNGDWEWIVPDTQPSESGIYGHGAALLPGNVMMIYGGYSISSTEAKTKRETSNVPTFLNLTSMSWSDDYTNPDYDEATQDSNSGTTSGDVDKSLGLGLGLGLGFAAIIIAIILYFLYKRRMRHRRTIRDSAIRALAQDTSRFLPHDDEMTEQDQSNGWYMGDADPYLRGNRSLGYQSLHARPSLDTSRQTWFSGAPPAQQVARKPLPRRNTYDPPSGVIHPIIEADEDGSLHDGDITSEPMSPARDFDGRRRDSDPFLTPTQETQISFPPPTRASATPSPEGRRGGTTDPEVQDWMTDVEAMDALLTRNAAAARSSGPNSPTRRGPNSNSNNNNNNNNGRSGRGGEDDTRTESNVSESNRSSIILGALSRSGSTRSHRKSNSALGFGGGVAAAAEEGRGGSSGSSSAPSYNTARSGFAALQAEGPALLMTGAKPKPKQNNNKNRNDDEDDDIIIDETPGSPSKSKPRRRSWLGSLRRALSSASRRDSTAGREQGRDVYDDDYGMSGEAEVGDYEGRLGGLSGIAAAGGLLRRKSGRGAWEAVEQQQQSQSQSQSPGYYGRGKKGKEKGVADRRSGMYAQVGDGDEEDYDDEWDIEKAVERRLVQVMFTVPREPLRVVNASPDMESGKDVVVIDPEEDSSSSLDEKQKLRRKSEERIEEIDLGLPLPSPSPVSDEDNDLGGEDEKDILREVQEELEAEWKLEKGKGKAMNHEEERGRHRVEPITPVRATPPRRNLQDEGIRLLSIEPSSESRKRKPSRSPVEDPDGDVFSAQAVRLERPRTRVLAMVQSIESISSSKSKSHESIPTGSPTR
ncbi:hypothetical protein M426DRAFT_317178 [Hypoxylon sp. CI-4A]|nr:hypothetical protein M426DRAFT_317178 [Hypoxylon sp. CI-4A]